PRLPAGPHVPGRRLLVRGPQHARRDRLRRLRGQAAPAVREGSGQDPRDQAGREAEAAGRVAGRRVRHRHLRPVRPAARLDRRDHRRPAEAQGPGLDLRPRDAGRARLRPGPEALTPPRSANPMPPQAGRRRRVAAVPKIELTAGQATPAPPVGTALGPHAVNIMDFCKQYNAATQAQAGNVVPVEITIYEDRSFSFVLKTPPAAGLLRKAAGGEKAAAEPHREKVGSVTRAQVREIAETKMPDLNAIDIEGAMKIVEGPAPSMGIPVAS